MTNGQWELEELEAVLEPEEGTQRSVSCRWKHGGSGPMGELGACSVPGLSGLLRAARATQCTGIHPAHGAKEALEVSLATAIALYKMMVKLS